MHTSFSKTSAITRVLSFGRSRKPSKGAEGSAKDGAPEERRRTSKQQFGVGVTRNFSFGKKPKPKEAPQPEGGALLFDEPSVCDPCGMSVICLEGWEGKGSVVGRGCSCCTCTCPGHPYIVGWPIPVSG